MVKSQPIDFDNYHPLQSSGTLPMEFGSSSTEKYQAKRTNTESGQTKFEKQATDQGAPDVGIINTSEFAVTPAPAPNTYVLFSGQFKSKAEATKALDKLTGKFKDAQVVTVKRSSSDSGQLVKKTAYGDVHKVEGFAPSAQKVASDTALVNQEAQKTGKNYVDSQKDLPDVIVVGGSGGGSSNPGAQGNGD